MAGIQDSIIVWRTSKIHGGFQLVIGLPRAVAGFMENPHLEMDVDWGEPYDLGNQISKTSSFQGLSQAAAFSGAPTTKRCSPHAAL